MTDIMQYAIYNSGFGVNAIAFALFFALLVTPVLRGLLAAKRAAGAVLRYALRLFPKPSLYNTLLYGALGIVFACARFKIHDWLEMLEDSRPSFVLSVSDSEATTAYENALRKHVDSYEFAVITRRTAETAQKIGCTPLQIYEVAAVECGMNPFVIHRDGVAAGWIQFTATGLSGFGVSLNDVKAACKRRDANTIMDLTERYLVRHAAGRALTRSVDVYCAVFAPAHIGKPDETVLYDSGEAYRMNAGLDGYGVVQEGRQQKIVRKFADGKITIKDLEMSILYKKGKIVK